MARTAGRLVLFLALALAAGCGVHRGVHREGIAIEPPHPLPAGDLMSARDRARLEALGSSRRETLADGGYRIGPDDLLDVHIPDLLEPPSADRGSHPGVAGAGPTALAEAPVAGQGLRVDGAGDVRVPHLGLVRAAGMTPTDLERDLGMRLRAAGLLNAPQVSVQVAEYRSHVVAVVGSVERPGLYPLTRPGATVSTMIWAAGGPSKDAGRVVEFVPAADTADPIRLDLEVLLHATSAEGRSLDPPVRPGDVVSLSPAGSVLVDGWVDKPGSYPVTRGLTVSGAVTAAGGHLFPADQRHVALKRVLGPGEERTFNVDLESVREGRAEDVPITDGDLVVLPARPARLIPWGVWAVTKEMIHVGGSVAFF